VGDILLFCQDSTQLETGQTGYLASLIAQAKQAIRIEIHGNASTEGPAGDYNFNLACKRAAMISGQFRDAGVSTPITLFMHGPTQAYGPQPFNRNVVIVFTLRKKFDIPPPPTIGPGPLRRTPEPERTCFGISCAAFEHLRNAHRAGETLYEGFTIQKAVRMEIDFLKRTKFKADYERIAPETLAYKPIPNVAREIGYKQIQLNNKVEYEARERIFKFISDQDPSFLLFVGGDLKKAVNSPFARE
jgi:hypothetical protein